jgi:hypothetical protein
LAADGRLFLYRCALFLFQFCMPSLSLRTDASQPSLLGTLLHTLLLDLSYALIRIRTLVSESVVLICGVLVNGANTNSVALSYSAFVLRRSSKIGNCVGDFHWQQQGSVLLFTVPLVVTLSRSSGSTNHAIPCAPSLSRIQVSLLWLWPATCDKRHLTVICGILVLPR